MTAPGSGNEHDDRGGLRSDLPRMIGRRQALSWMGGAGLAGLLAACGLGRDDQNATTSSGTPVSTASDPVSESTVSPETTSASMAVTTTAGGVTQASPGAEIPDETAGPFPADGSNGPSVLDDDGVVRSDLTTSFAGLAGTAAGVPIRFNLTLVEAETGEPVPGAIVYLWHCTADGRYSVYEVTDQNYLRGAQMTDAAGRITFTSIFPGCYAGRWPHAHFEVYSDFGDITNPSAAIKTSQLALPQADCETVFSDARYGNSAANLSRLSLSTDGVFRDGWTDQLAVVTGSVEDGYDAALLVRI